MVRGRAAVGVPAAAEHAGPLGRARRGSGRARGVGGDLLRHAHRPVTRTMIVEHVWDIHFDSVSNVVDVHINSLRNKIDRDFGPPLIHTIRGVGYMLTDRSV